MRTLLALLRLMGRSFTRAKLPGRRMEHATSGLLLRLFTVVGLGFQGWNGGRIFASTPEAVMREVGWLAASLALVATAAGVLAALPFLRSTQPLLRHAVLATLPVNEASRTVAELASLYLVYVYAAGSAWAAVGPRGVPYALALTLAFAALGNGALRSVRRALTTSRVGWTRNAALATLFVGYGVGPLKGLLGKAGVLTSLVDALGRAWQRHGLADLVLPLGVLTVGALLIVRAERVGYDRVDLVPEARVKTASARELGLGSVEAVLARREPGGRAAPYLGPVVSLLVVGGLFALFHHAPTEPSASERRVLEALPKVAQFYVFFLAFSLVLGAANRAAARDATARPLLSPLPIAPRDLLRGRARLLRRRMALALAPLVCLCALPVPGASRASIAWHVGSLLLAGWLLGETAACVAFLSDGIATPTRSKWTLANYLVMFPIPGIVLAEHPWDALLPLAFVALTAREARDASLAVVRWLDDDEEGREATASAPWRALVVFGAFATSQSLFARALDAAPLELSAATVALGAYVLSAVLLVALTAAANGLRGLFARPWHLGRGALAGALSAALAVGWTLLLRRWDLVPAPAAGTRGALGVLALVVAAPLAEEIFFRGWLQSALVQRRPGSFAPVALGALLFAIVHPLPSFVPVFTLGVLTGHLRLRSGGVAAGCLAHAIHNGAVLLLG